jgi:hypothetical protein
VAPAKTRLSTQIREGVRLMVEDGLTRPLAAEKVGILDNSLYKALRRPDVRSLRNDLLRGCRESAASGVVKRVLDLATGAKSDAVKLDANRFLADVAQEGPVHRGEITHHHTGQQPGMTLVLVAAPPQPAIIDQPAPVRMTTINAMPKRVPHPSERQ